MLQDSCPKFLMFQLHVIVPEFLAPVYRSVHLAALALLERTRTVPRAPTPPRPALGDALGQVARHTCCVNAPSHTHPACHIFTNSDQKGVDTVGERESAKSVL